MFGKICNVFLFRRLVGSRLRRSGGPSVAYWSSWTNTGNRRWGGNQRKLRGMIVVPTIRELTNANRGTTRKSNWERENTWKKYTKVREGNGQKIGMWIERERSCFPKPKNLLRRHVEAYGTKRYGKATLVLSQVLTWSAERLTRRNGSDGHGTWRPGGADRAEMGRMASGADERDGKTVAGRWFNFKTCKWMRSRQRLSRDMLAIFRESGRTELQIGPSEWFWEIVDVMLA